MKLINKKLYPALLTFSMVASAYAVTSSAKSPSQSMEASLAMQTQSSDLGSVQVVEKSSAAVTRKPFIEKSSTPRPSSIIAKKSSPPAKLAGSPSSYALSYFSPGVVVRWNPCKTLTYKVNAAKGGTNALLDAKEAASRVSRATGIPLTYTGATTFVPQKGNTSLPGTDLVIVWAPSSGAGASNILPGGSTAGIGGWKGMWGWSAAENRNLSPQIVAGYAVLDSSKKLTPGFGVGVTRGALLEHELGHAFGLNHVTDQSQIMYPSVTNKSSNWGAGDAAGFQKVGKGAGCL